MADAGGAFFSDGIGGNIQTLMDRIVGDTADIMLEGAQQMLDWAKANAPWADRTGAAREGLDVDVDQGENEVTITLFHTVDYGLWLEVIQGGRFGIILQTIESFGPQIIEAAGGTMDAGGLEEE